MPRHFRTGVLSCLLVLGFILPVQAGVVVYEEGAKKIEIGGRMQIQYLRVDPEDGDSVDDLFFRRLRPYLLGTVTEDWLAKIQVDFGEADGDNEVKIKDAYAQYLGLENNKFTIGNSKAPFSREFQASSKRQQLVERSFVGDHNFGSPDRQLGIRWDGHTENKKLTYAVSFGAESIDPGVNRLDFDTPVNRDNDYDEGWLGAARIDIHPLGFVAFDQADFNREKFKFNVSLAAFTWSNDNDNNTLTDPVTGLDLDGTDGKVDLDSADGIEISAGFRGHGFSADAEYNNIDADTVDSTFTGGLYLNGSTELDVYALEGGYLFSKINLELVAGWDSLDADNYESKFERTSVGLNWYWNQHQAKLQATYQMVENSLGVKGDDEDVMFVQMQFVF